MSVARATATTVRRRSQPAGVTGKRAPDRTKLGFQKCVRRIEQRRLYVARSPNSANVPEYTWLAWSGVVAAVVALFGAASALATLALRFR